MFSDRLKILLVEDDEDDHFLMRQMLADALHINPELFWVQTGEEATRAFREREIDVCLLDYRLGAQSGLDLLREFNAIAPRVPIILMTGFGDRSVDLEAMRLGASDYLVKGRIDADLLERSIRYALENKRGEEQLKRRNAELLEAMEALNAADEEIRRRNEDLLQASRLIEEQRMRYEDLFENAPDVYLVTDLDGRIREANRAAKQLLGAGADALLGKALDLFVVKEDKKLLQTGLVRLKRLKGAQEWELRIKSGKSRPLDVSISILNVRDSAGNVSVRWLIRDISARKRAEKALHKSRSELRLLSSKLLHTQEEERKRIAKELHDGIGSSLSATKLGLERALCEMKEGIYRPELLGMLVSTTQQTIDEMRRITTDLRPSVLDDFGLLPTINWFCGRFRSIHPTTSVQQDIRLQEQEIPQDLKIVIFRIVQEAFNNVAKHSEADSVTVFLRKNSKGLELVIEDNGKGFERKPAGMEKQEIQGQGMGLTSMRERAELSEGSFTIESEKGKGTVVRATWAC